MPAYVWRKGDVDWVPKVGRRVLQMDEPQTAGTEA